ncbi:hypothetical protein ACHAPI_010571 [Fusarium lateritium]
MSSTDAFPRNAGSNPPLLRRLLPASSGDRPQQPPPPSTVPKRINVVSACEACRKSKCNAGRPKCARCITKRRVCHYESDAHETRPQALKRKYGHLKSQQSSLEYIVDAVRSRSQADADAIVRRIRNGDDVEVLAQHLKHGDLLLQASLVPETRYRYEFPLLSRMPASLLKPTNPYLHSLIYEWTWRGINEANAPRPPSSSVHPSSAARDSDAPFLMPFHAAEIGDAEFLSIEPARWTTVSTDNRLMRKLLAAFFLQDWSWYPMFQKEYFLQDMAAMSSELCSSLLVNVVLAVGCSYYRGLGSRAEFWNPSTYGYRFLSEAKRLWEHAQDSNDLTTVQAGMVFNLIYNMNGADKLGFAYTIRACQMAHHLGLFKESAIVRSNRLCNARNFTAWTLFVSQSIFTFGFYRAPLLDGPPTVELPDPLKDPQWYGELWFRYPLNATLHPSNFGQYFKARIDYEKIMNDRGKRLFASTRKIEALSATETAEFYLRFRTWFDQLPEPLSPRNVVLPSALKLHLFLGQLLFRLVRSRIRAEDLEVLRHFAKFDDAILTAQEKHLWQAKSEWPVDIVSNVDDPDAKRLSLVLKQYKSEVSDELMSEASIL